MQARADGGGGCRRSISGVNIDHVATLRQVRRAAYPDPLLAALIAEQSGADSITLHLREDRRHIQDHDVRRMRAALQTRMNLEMAATDAMVAFAREIAAAGLLSGAGAAGGGHDRGRARRGGPAPAPDARSAGRSPRDGIRVSLFIDPETRQIDASRAAGAPVVELHTGAYAEATGEQPGARACAHRGRGAASARSLGLTVHAGHGLHYHNVQPVAAIDEIVELNIGHAIVARAIVAGIAAAVQRNEGADARCAPVAAGAAGRGG